MVVQRDCSPGATDPQKLAIVVLPCSLLSLLHAIWMVRTLDLTNIKLFIFTRVMKPPRSETLPHTLHDKIDFAHFQPPTSSSTRDYLNLVPWPRKVSILGHFFNFRCLEPLRICHILVVVVVKGERSRQHGTNVGLISILNSVFWSRSHMHDPRTRKSIQTGQT